ARRTSVRRAHARPGTLRKLRGTGRATARRHRDRDAERVARGAGTHRAGTRAAGFLPETARVVAACHGTARQACAPPPPRSRRGLVLPLPRRSTGAAPPDP